MFFLSCDFPRGHIGSNYPDRKCQQMVIALFTVYIFDFEIRNKQMFTEARAFSRVTYFFIFWRASWIFFLNLHSKISYPTPFSETVQRDNTNFGPFLFYSVAK